MNKINMRMNNTISNQYNLKIKYRSRRCLGVENNEQHATN